MIILLLIKDGFDIIILITYKFSKQVTFIDGADT